MANNEVMTNFSDRVLEAKGRHIKAKYAPLQFAMPEIDQYVKDKPMGHILHKFFNCKTQNATIDIHGREYCRPERGRSYYDAYRLMMHYKPDVTFKEMYKFIHEKCTEEYERIGKRNRRVQDRDIYWWGSPYAGRAFWTCPNIGRARYSGEYNTKFK